MKFILAFKYSNDTDLPMTYFLTQTHYRFLLQNSIKLSQS